MIRKTYRCFICLYIRTHKEIRILGGWTTWRTILFYVFIFNSLHVSSTSCSSSGETNCVNTTSGSCRWPCRVQVLRTRRGHRNRVTATRGCIDTMSLLMMSTMCSKHVESYK
jgi:hypothetical protein